MNGHYGNNEWPRDLDGTVSLSLDEYPEIVLVHDILVLTAKASSEGSDESAHPRSLVWTITARTHQNTSDQTLTSDIVG